MITAARDIFDYLLVVSDKKNEVILLATEIKDRVGICQSSISKGRKQLQELDFIRRRGAAVYMINPAIACKVSGEQREKLYDVYASYPAYGQPIFE